MLGGILLMEGNNQNVSVLIVDDSTLNIRFISNVISPLGYKTYVAKTGIQALAVLKKINPSIIIMDVNMPEMDGFDCCQHIKSSADKANIPIIFVSGSHDEKDKEKAIDLGAAAYITKPISVDTLVYLLEENIPFAKIVQNQ